MPCRGRMLMATAPSPNDLTRQQLDELDALLQRMLSLPLNPPDATTPAPVATLSAFTPPLPPMAAPAPAPPPRPVEPPPAYADSVSAPTAPCGCGSGSGESRTAPFVYPAPAPVSTPPAAAVPPARQHLPHLLRAASTASSGPEGRRAGAPKPPRPAPVVAPAPAPLRCRCLWLKSSRTKPRESPNRCRCRRCSLLSWYSTAGWTGFLGCSAFPAGCCVLDS